MLSWSAEETNRTIDLAAIVDSGVELGIPGGRELIAIARAAAGKAVDSAPIEALAQVVGPEPAVRAAAVAGAFELYNRIVDATGLPVGRASRAQSADTIEVLGLDAFPHARHDG